MEARAFEEIAPITSPDRQVDTPDWRELGRTAATLVGTPCFAASERHVAQALAELTGFTCVLPRRHWLSLKTQPVRPLLNAWSSWGYGVEVVSVFELAAALSSAVPPERILVNGVGKHHWLPAYSRPALNVHFDSLTEVTALADVARQHRWHVGLRCQTPSQSNGHAAPPDQFGLTAEEIATAVTILDAAGVPVKGLHFHLYTNVACVEAFAAAVSRLRLVCDRTGLAPEYIDVGGGLPVSGERPVSGALAASATFALRSFHELLSSLPSLFPGLREVWLENGRFVTARAGVLVVKVLDRKDRPDGSYLLCDGGRTNHARMASEEVHGLVIDPERTGPCSRVSIVGPTCAAVDRLGTWSLPASVQPGDLVVWLNAGAYHIPLETRFSFGLAPIVWFDGALRPHVARRRETPDEWWR